MSPTSHLKVKLRVCCVVDFPRVSLQTVSLQLTLTAQGPQQLGYHVALRGPVLRTRAKLGQVLCSQNLGQVEESHHESGGHFNQCPQVSTCSGSSIQWVPQ